MSIYPKIVNSNLEVKNIRLLYRYVIPPTFPKNNALSLGIAPLPIIVVTTGMSVSSTNLPSLVTSGPGATNLVTAIATANYDAVPLVCFTGQVVTSLIGMTVESIYFIRSKSNKLLPNDEERKVNPNVADNIVDCDCKL